MYDRTGLSPNCTPMKTGFNNLRTGTKANFRPFVDAMVFVCNVFGNRKDIKIDISSHLKMVKRQHRIIKTIVMISPNYQKGCYIQSMQLGVFALILCTVTRKQTP